MTYSQLMGNTQVEFTAREEEGIIDIEDDEFEFFGPPRPITIEDHIKHQVDVSDKVPSPPLIPVPYPKAAPKTLIIRPKEGNPIIAPERQK
jgi:hypothetical protein